MNSEVCGLDMPSQSGPASCCSPGWMSLAAAPPPPDLTAATLLRHHTEVFTVKKSNISSFTAFLSRYIFSTFSERKGAKLNLDGQRKPSAEFHAGDSMTSLL